MNESALSTLRESASAEASGTLSYNLIAGLERRKAVSALAFTLSDGERIVEPYHAIGRARCSYNGDSLVFHASRNTMLVCTGDNLQELIPYLQARTLRHLHCYDPAIHHIGEGTADTMPVIYQIEEVEEEV